MTRWSMFILGIGPWRPAILAQHSVPQLPVTEVAGSEAHQAEIVQERGDGGAEGDGSVAGLPPGPRWARAWSSMARKRSRPATSQ